MVGVAQRVNVAIDAIDDISTGSLTVRKNALTSQLSSLTTQISRKEDALSAYLLSLDTPSAALYTPLCPLTLHAALLISQG